MIGKPVEDTLYRDNSSRLGLDGTGRDVAKELADLMSELPKEIYQPVKNRQHSTLANTRKVIADSSLQDLSLVEKDGKVYQKHGDELIEFPKAYWQIARDFLKLKQSADNLMNAQLSPETTDQKLADLRETMTQNYDRFVENYGYINKRKNLKILGSDPNYGRVAALETYKLNPKTKEESAEKSDMFFKRTVSPITTPTSAETAVEALTISLSQRGNVDMNYMAKLTGRNESELVKELGDAIYKNPMTNLQETADEYLSGNVREKLAIAQEAVKTNPEFKRNVEALERVQPKDYTEKEVSALLGAPWIGAKYHKDFINYMLDGAWNNGEVTISPTIGAWVVEGASSSPKNSYTWGVPNTKWNFLNLIQAIMNKHTPVVKYTDRIAGQKVTKTDEVKTAAVANKIKEIKQEFEKWIWSYHARKKYADRALRRRRKDLGNDNIGNGNETNRVDKEAIIHDAHRDAVSESQTISTTKSNAQQDSNG